MIENEENARLRAELKEAYKELDHLRVRMHNLEMELERAHARCEELVTKNLKLSNRESIKS